MVTKEEFLHLVSEIEAFRDMMLEEVGKLRNQIEIVEEDLKELKKDLKITNKKLG
jgi:hypothetical protein